jgi:nicotinamidase-related amidase
MKGGAGWEVHPDLDQQPNDVFIEKRASDAFYQTPLQAQLEEFGMSRVIVTGKQTEYCVDTTCRSALSKDFDVLLIADGHTTGASHLSARGIIEHHNTILTNLAHPNASLRLIPAVELGLGDLLNLP